MCAGIGDNLWLMMKMMSSSNERFNFILDGHEPQRGKQLFDLLPQVAASATYDPILTYNRVKKGNIQKRKKLWKNIHDQLFYLTMNEHLEAGNRIEDFFPDLPTTFKIHYHTSLQDCKDYFSMKIPKESIGIYCSSYAGSRNWGTWMEKEWLDLIKMIHIEYGGKYGFVLIGAKWDIDLSSGLAEGMRQAKIPHWWAVEQSLGTTIEILKGLKYFIGFPSGLSIINESLEKDGIMFYSEAIKKIIGTWANPTRIKNGNIIETVFTDPKKVFSWIVDNNKLG